MRMTWDFILRLFAAGALGTVIGPVSYTHLDVYKRQYYKTGN